MKKISEKIKSVNHLFSKIVVTWCVAVGTVASFYALRILSNTGHDASATLAIILGFFGGELLILCLKTILKRENASNLDTEGGTYRE